MTGPTRFKNDARSSQEGYLMSLGSEEMPEPEALQRAAQRLRISAAFVAAASVGLAATEKASAVSLGDAGVAASRAGTHLGTLGATTLIKGTVVGLSVGLVVFAAPHFWSFGHRHVERPVAAPVVANRPQLSSTLGNGAPAPMAAASAALDSEPLRGAARGGLVVAASSSQRVAAREPLTERQRSLAESPQAEPPSHARLADAESASSQSRASSKPSASALVPEEPASAEPIAPESVRLKATAKNDPRLIREVTSLDQVRAQLSRGNASGALRDFEAFEQRAGYRLLRREALLVQIDVLTVLGRRQDAAASARLVARLGLSAAERARLEPLLRQEP